MKFLIDTHLLIWAAQASQKLSAHTREMLDDKRNSLFFSAASIWEISFKFARGRPDFEINPKLLRDELLKNGYAEVTITGEHAIAVMELPGIHKDPFDKLLIAQAKLEGMILLTADATLARYPGPIMLA